MNTHPIAAKLASTDYYKVDTYADPRGNVCISVHNGCKLATLTEQTDGTVAVALFIDYGTDGRSYCDGATYKTAAGSVRKVRGFLG